MRPFYCPLQYWLIGGPKNVCNALQNLDRIEKSYFTLKQRTKYFRIFLCIIEIIKMQHVTICLTRLTLLKSLFFTIKVFYQTLIIPAFSPNKN